MTSPNDPTAQVGAVPSAESASERTARIPVTSGGPRWFGPPPEPPAGPEPGPSGDDDGGGRARRRRKPLLVGAAVVGLLALVYVGDLVVSSTDVPRGVAVAGIEIGGMSKPEANAALREAFASRLDRPVALRAGDATASIDPRAAGLDIDWDATLDRAGEQPFNPWTRLTSLFTSRDVAPVSKGNPFAVGQALAALRPQIDRAPAEGTIVFRDATPVAVPSRSGQAVDQQAGVGAVLEHWLDPTPVDLPVASTPTSVTQQGIDTAMNDVARPAVAGPITVVGTARNATLSPTAIGSVLRFDPDGSGGLTPRVDADATRRALTPQLGSTEAKPKDASFTFAGAQATVVPAVVGRAIDYPRTTAAITDALRRPVDGVVPPVFTPPPSPPGAPPAEPPAASGRAANAVYTTTPPKITTESLQALGPAEMIGQFKTTGFKPDSGQNIKRVAEQVNGATVAPGETFSLNGFTGPRDASQGYVEAGIIDDGVPGRGVGGGISQFATTLYNATYFAGLDEVEHKEHSYYISRYPAAREATVFEGAIDLKFRNDGQTPILIRTLWTPGSIEVQIYGQKRFDVTSEPGPRTNPVPAGTRDLSANPKCAASKGVDGFTTSDTRVLRDVRTGQVTREPRTVRYNPEPEITCNAR